MASGEDRDARQARGDAVHVPEKRGANPGPPSWWWAIIAAWLAVFTVVFVLEARKWLIDDGGATEPFIATATATVAPPVVETAPAAATPTASPAAAPMSTPQPTMSAPTVTALLPTATILPTAAPPTAMPLPLPTPLPPPPPTEPPPPPPVPSFRATDRIGVPVPVNLRAGPGTTFASLGALPPGTLLAATGESTYAGGYTWRHFRLADGRLSWIRQIDVLPLP